MSLMGRLADTAETEAGVTSTGSSTGRAAYALEQLAGVSNLTRGPGERIALATAQLATDAGETPASADKHSEFQRGAINLELYKGTGIYIASPIERMILALGGELTLIDDMDNILVDDEGNVLKGAM